LSRKIHNRQAFDKDKSRMSIEATPKDTKDTWKSIAELAKKIVEQAKK